MSRVLKNYFHALRRDVTNTQPWFGRILIADMICWFAFLSAGSATGHPGYFTLAALTMHCLWMGHAIHMRRVAQQFTVTDWGNFLDGREDLGEYEELGGKYEDDDDGRG